MTGAAGALAAAIVVAGLSSWAGAAGAQPFDYPPQRVEWIAAQGHFGFSGFPWSWPPLASPIPTPAYGCYLTRARIKDAWRAVEVCS